MNPILQAALGSVIRFCLGIVAGYLVKAGIWSGSESEGYVAAATIALLTLAWSLWEKYKSRIKFLTALSMPAGTTEKEVHDEIKTGNIEEIKTAAMTGNTEFLTKK